MDVVECEDRPELAEYCAKWAADGRCTANPLLMATNCARTCNLCQSRTATPPPVSHSFTTIQHNTSLPADADDGINTATTTLNYLASSTVSTQRTVNAVSNNTLLTSVLSPGDDSTLASNTVSDMSTHSSLNYSQLNITTTNVHTTSGALLNFNISSVPERNVTSLDPSVEETSVTHSVTSSVISKSLMRASHSSAAHVSGRVKTTIVTDSSMVTTRQVMTSPKVNDSVVMSRQSHIVDQLTTSTSPPVQQTETQLHSAVTSVSYDDNVMTSVALDVSLTTPPHDDDDMEDYLSGTFTSTQPARTDDSSAATLMSQTNAAAAEKVSREGLLTSSAREVLGVSLYGGISETVTDSVSRLMTNDNVRSIKPVRPHTMPTLSQSHTHKTTTSASSRHTSVDQQSRSVSTVQMSEIDFTATSSTNSITNFSSYGSSGVDFTTLAKEMPDNTHVIGAVENSSTSVTGTNLSTDVASTGSMTRVHSVTDYVNTITRGVSFSDTQTIHFQALSSEETTKSHQPITSSFHNSSRLEHVGSDGTVTESISSPNSFSNRSALHMTDSLKSVSPGSTSIPGDMSQVTGYSSSPSMSDNSLSNDSTLSTTPLPTLNFSTVNTLWATRPSITSPFWSSTSPQDSFNNVTTPLDNSPVRSSPASHEVKSSQFTAEVLFADSSSHANYTSDRLIKQPSTASGSHVPSLTSASFNNSDGYATQKLTDNFTDAMAALSLIHI